MKKILLGIWLSLSIVLAFADAPPTLTIGGVTWTQCAVEGGNCVWSGGGNRVVAFGDGLPDDPTLQIVQSSAVSSGKGCFDGGLFNTDPAPGFNKGCYTNAGSAPPPAPTVTLTASSNNVVPGTLVTLTWSSTNATSCGGVGTGISGSTTVSPTVTTTYSETCSGTTSPPGTSSVTVTVQQQCNNSGFTVGNPSTINGGTANGTIWADTPDPNNLRVFGNNSQFSVVFTTSLGGPDTVQWVVKDTFGTQVAAGSFPVPAGTSTTTLPITSSLAGYFTLSATTHGGSLPQRGTEPAGYIAFGVLPSATVVPAVTYASIDQHRFGMQGFNSNYAALQVLGVTDTIDDRQQSWGEPNGPNTYTPSVNDLDQFYRTHSNITRLVRLDGIPAWNSPTGLFNDSYSLPVNLTEYGQYMAKVGTDTKLIHDQFYPTATHNYYQVTWEPSLGWPQSQGSTFTQLYSVVYPALHSTDPLATVMGPAEPFPNNGSTASGNRITSSQGICAYLDGVTTHGYFNAPTVPSNPPELQDGMAAADAANALDNEMKGLRSTMQACKPNMKLFNTEVGISYDSGVSYSGVTSNHLYAHGAVGVRSHIIILGEGAQRTYYFFGPDFPDSLAGYGSFFDLVNTNGGFGDSILAPKPEAMAFAVLARILDGTSTLGPYTLPACNVAAGCVHTYAFQQLNNGKVISALWWHKNANWIGPSSFSSTASTTYTLTVDSPNTSGSVSVLDMFGNRTSVGYTNGQMTLTLTESPIYVVSNNATVTKTQVTAPVGYTGQ